MERLFGRSYLIQMFCVLAVTACGPKDFDPSTNDRKPAPSQAPGENQDDELGKNSDSIADDSKATDNQVAEEQPLPKIPELIPAPPLEEEKRVEMMRECGLSKDGKLQSELSLAQLTALPFRIMGRFNLTNYSGNASGLIKHALIEGNILELDRQLTVNNTNPGRAKSEAQKDLTKSAAKLRFQLQSFLTDDSAVRCGMLLAKRLQVVRGGRSVIWEFSAPTPVHFSSTVSLSKMQAEVKEKSEWQDLLVRVVETNDNNFPMGKELRGNIKIESIPNRLQVVRDGADEIIEASMAFRINADFGSLENNQSLGFVPSISYFFDGDKGKFKAVVFETKEENSAPMYFMGK